MSARLIQIFLVFTCLTAVAQEPDAAAILHRVAQAYADLKSQHIEAVVVLDMKTQGIRMEMPITVAVAKPDKVRFEIKNPMAGSQTVSDGQSTWTYVAMLKQFTKKTASPGVSSMSGPGDILNGERVLDRLKTATKVREEKLSLDGVQIDCYVIEAEYTPKAGDQQVEDGPKTLWVDKNRSVILKASSSMKMKSSPMGGPMQMAQTATVLSIKLNEPLPDSLFQFVPPEGAKEVDELTPPGMKHGALRGKDASDFVLLGLDKIEHRLSGYRGKIVLLDFWTTWCAPCRADMPALQKLHEESAEEGVTVVTINVGEDAEVIREFMVNHKYTFPVLMARFGDQVISEYQVRAFPTMVVVGKDGKIISHKVGSGGDAAIRAMLTEAAAPAGKQE